MSTTSWNFLAFAAIVSLAWQLSAQRVWRNGVFLIANLAFLSTISTDVAMFIPLGLFLLAGFCAVKLIARSKSRVLLTVSVAGLTLAFCWMKKYWFLGGLGFLETAYITIGLSYIFFRVLHLVIDAKDDGRVAAIGPVDYANYTLNFTTLVAGPIQRYDGFTQEVEPLDLPIAGRAVERIIIGFFKVLVAGGMIASIHDSALAELERQAGGIDRVRLGLVAIGSYPIYLFFNFSGYVDIVVGVARFIGMKLPENFNRPFSAVNFVDFWARWHMTLSNWLKDYVYTPLVRVMMTRVSRPSMDPFLGIVAFFVTFFLIGIWHGPTLIFAVYGLLLATGVSINKLYQTALIARLGRKRYRVLSERAVYRACSRGLTFTWFGVSLICFWATWPEAVELMRVLGLTGLIGCFFGLWIVASPILALIEASRNRLLAIEWGGAPALMSRYMRTVWATVLLFLCLTFVLLTETAAPDIVYKAF